jgi:hypothetical protein
LDVGTHLSVTIVDYYTGNPAYDQSEAAKGWTCNFGFDLAAGQVLDMRVVQSVDNYSCLLGEPEIAPFGGWTLTPKQAEAEVLGASYTMSNGACTGLTTLELFSTVADVTASPQMGKVPPAILQRAFLAASTPSDADGGAPCPGNCQGDFVVQVKRLP